MKIKDRISVAFLGLLTFLLPSVVRAISPDLLELLVTNGQISQAQADTLIDKNANFTAKGKNTQKVRFNGRMQFQYDNFNAEQGDRTEGTNQFYFRRLFLGAKASLTDDLYGVTVLDFAGDTDPEIAFDAAYIGYKGIKPLKIELGFKKVPFGYEETYSSSKTVAIERSVVNRFFADDLNFSARHMGIHLSGDLGAGFSGALAIGNVSQNAGSKQGNQNMTYFGRLRWENDLSDNASLLLGVDYGFSSENDEATAEIDDDNKGKSEVTASTIYAVLNTGTITATAEYFTSEVKDLVASENGKPKGYALGLSGKLNSFEPVVRYSVIEGDGIKLDIDDLVRRAADAGQSDADGELSSTYFGVNYYFSKSVKAMFGYEMAEFEPAADNGVTLDISGFRSRLQLLW